MRLFAGWLLLGSILGTQAGTVLGADRAPNIVLIVADDLGWGDVGFNGRTEWTTPHLDRLAADGVVLKHCYSAAPICGPSRGAILTGKYTIHTGVRRNDQDLPLEEVHANGSSSEFALLITGDGGWAGLDRELAARLAANGVPTVGLNSLKYFWTERTPDETARDVGRVLRHYLSVWHKQRVLLVGYSFGADVLPFIVNRLPPDLRERIASVSLLGIDAHASFEVRVSDWVGGDGGGPPTRPELEEVRHVPLLCIYGEGEEDSICPGLSAGTATREKIGRGHHFSGEYATLADRILAFTRSGRPVT